LVGHHLLYGRRFRQAVDRWSFLWRDADWGRVFFALGMAETVAIRAARLRRPILVMFGGLLVVEAVLALIFLV